MKSLVPLLLGALTVVGLRLVHIRQNYHPKACQPPQYLFAFGFRGVAPNFSRLRALKMLRRNPTFIIAFCATSRSRSGRIRTPSVNLLALSA